MHDWRKIYERYWAHRIGLIRQWAERRMLDQIARESQTGKTRRDNHGGWSF